MRTKKVGKKTVVVAKRIKILKGVFKCIDRQGNSWIETEND